MSRKCNYCGKQLDYAGQPHDLAACADHLVQENEQLRAVLAKLERAALAWISEPQDIMPGEEWIKRLDELSGAITEAQVMLGKNVSTETERLDESN